MHEAQQDARRGHVVTDTPKWRLRPEMNSYAEMYNSQHYRQRFQRSLHCDLCVSSIVRQLTDVNSSPANMDGQYSFNELEIELPRSSYVFLLVT